MQVIDGYRKLEHQWKAVDIYLEPYFDSMLDVLLKSPGSARDQRNLNDILNSCDTKISPLRLFRSYSYFYAHFNHLYVNRLETPCEENTPYILSYILFEENRLSLVSNTKVRKKIENLDNITHMIRCLLTAREGTICQFIHEERTKLDLLKHYVINYQAKATKIKDFVYLLSAQGYIFSLKRKLGEEIRKEELDYLQEIMSEAVGKIKKGKVHGLKSPGTKDPRALFITLHRLHDFFQDIGNEEYAKKIRKKLNRFKEKISVIPKLKHK